MSPKKPTHRGKLLIVEEHPELGFGKYLITFSQGGTSPRYMNINPDTGKTSGFIGNQYAADVQSGYQLLKESKVGKLLADFSTSEIRKLSLAVLQNQPIILDTDVAQRTLEEQIVADPTGSKLLEESDYHLDAGRRAVDLAYSASQRSVQEALNNGNDAGALSLLQRSLGIGDFGKNYQRAMASKVMTPQTEVTALYVAQPTGLQQSLESKTEHVYQA
tara:strand:- start:3538 stop:4191 length:654 start_codon:yes stop_codon:yes gene_type:complete